MQEPLLALAPSDLRALALQLRTGRLAAPYTASAIQRSVCPSLAGEIGAALAELATTGMSGGAMARALELLADGIDSRPPVESLVHVVTTGPEVGGVTNEDTPVIIDQLFRRAVRSVLVAGYAVHQGQQVFRSLADHMAECPALDVRLFLDIQRKPGDTSAAGQIVSRFVERFRNDQWPQDRPLPRLFYDPRSLALDPNKRVCLHAKCVVVDGAEVLVSSANFTEAAQQRNTEVGLLVQSTVIAERLTRFFDSLAKQGIMRAVTLALPRQ